MGVWDLYNALKYGMWAGIKKEGVNIGLIAAWLIYLMLLVFSILITCRKGFLIQRQNGYCVHISTGEN